MNTRPNLIWHVADTLLASVLEDEPPPLQLPTEGATQLTIRAHTFTHLVECGHTHDGDTVRWLWEALTPTTFRKRGRHLPAPDVGSFLASLAAHWNEAAPTQLHVDVEQVIEVARAASTHSLRGGTHATANSVPGFTGVVEAQVKRTTDREGFATVVTLLHAADYLGAGDYREHGMGGTAVQVHPELDAGLVSQRRGRSSDHARESARRVPKERR
jgi:CRISPR/Cas system endoribonuclease Cas6 (RAMP superfamily)